MSRGPGVPARCTDASSDEVHQPRAGPGPAPGARRAAVPRDRRALPVGLRGAARGQPRRQAPAVARVDGCLDGAHGLRAGPPQGDLPPVGGYREQPPSARPRGRDRRDPRARGRAPHRGAAARLGRPLAAADDAVADTDARAPAGAVHRLRARRGVQGRADRDRHHPVHRPRRAAAHRGDPGRADRQGADPRGEHAADPLPGAAAADPAAPRRCGAALARGGLAVPDRRRGHRLDRRARLPGVPRAPLPRDGRDPPLRRVDHVPRLRDGSRAPRAEPAAVPVGDDRRGDGGAVA